MLVDALYDLFSHKSSLFWVRSPLSFSHTQPLAGPLFVCGLDEMQSVRKAMKLARETHHGEQRGAVLILDTVYQKALADFSYEAVERALADHEFYAPNLVIEVIDRAPHVFLDAIQDAALELAAQYEEDANEDARRHINPFEADTLAEQWA